jgi:hypothetical protein
MKALYAIVATVVVGGLALLLFVNIFSHVFHLFEYAAVALVAGWVGYKLGHFQGRHEHEPDS